MLCIFFMHACAYIQRKEFASLNLNTPDDCNNPFDLHERLKSLTMWQNESLSSLCYFLPGVQALVEQFSHTVLPVTGKALVSLLVYCMRC